MPGYGEYAIKGRGLIPWSWAVERLAKAHSYWVSTVRPDGRPHVMPVWGLWQDDSFYFSTGTESRKARNLAANPHCVVHVEPAKEAVIVEGVAEAVTDPALLKRLCDVYNGKYDWDAEGWPFYAVRPRVAFCILENTDDDTDCLTRWEFDHE